MKNFSDINILGRLEDVIQKKVDDNTNITEKIDVSCIAIKNDNNDIIRIYFEFDSISIDINNSISSLKGINDIIEISDIKNSMFKDYSFLDGIGAYLGSNENGKLTVTVFLHKDNFEQTNLFKSISTIQKFNL